MALYTISDLHLPLGIDKPMDIFGKSWENYVERLYDNWQNVVGVNDTIVLSGDFSWATYIEQSKADFEFLQKLNGNKILLKGNHDYWWTTVNKMNEFFIKNNFTSVKILQNNAYMYKNIAICGTRGWIYGDNLQAEDKKIYDREIIRLELSLNEGIKNNPDEIYVFTHYPPANQYGTETDFTKMMKKYNVKKCIYGHLHAASHHHAIKGNIDGIEYILTSGDYVNFCPIKLSD